MQIEFHGLVVLGSGDPVPGARVKVFFREYVDEGGDNFFGIGYEAELVTDEEGRFSLSEPGVLLIVRDVAAEDGLWLYDLMDNEQGRRNSRNTGYGYSNRGRTGAYQADPDRPAVFVLVREGEEVRVWPSRGGREAYADGEVLVNRPIRPRSPSVPLPAVDGE